ncbi:hypothetical protein ACZ87_03207 [Candidatus Erwinia dacicola]|uniref:Uncharacterized protein n=1 Tax=Candidatus Erwinia dacicola TaxID=252393 RepID=A0A328THB0_9GAMM|nr:hypothetical protein ACZ87_03207 [Candidatus Erwinia dacicola]
MLTKCELLKIVKPGGSLYIGQRLRRCFFQPIKQLPAAKCPLELAYKFLKMVFDHPIKVYQIPVDIVQHFD